MIHIVLLHCPTNVEFSAAESQSDSVLLTYDYHADFAKLIGISDSLASETFRGQQQLQSNLDITTSSV